MSTADEDRPKSKYADWEDPPQEGEPFDYDAKPNRFYFEVETSGSMDPDQIVQEGIRELQRKLGSLLKTLDPRKYGGDEDNFDGARSPDMNMDGGGWNDQGYGDGNQTAYGGGGQTAYGGGGMTSYGGGQTAYGGGGQTAYGGQTSYGGNYGSGTSYGGSSWQ